MGEVFSFQIDEGALRRLVGELDDFILLIVVSQYDETVSQFLLPACNDRTRLLIRHRASSMIMEMSSALTEWVISPAEI